MSYKVCVYAICKNEIKHVDRWMASMKEADEIYVLDTGSDDGTPERLQALGAHVVRRTLIPWRFDDARNASLALVPQDADICVCTDLDEVFDSGWRFRLELFWAPDTTCARYRYVWNTLEDGTEGIVFMRNNIHTRENFVWKSPVHEHIEYTGDSPNEILLQGVCLRHYPDVSKSRAQYLPLLELSAAEEPDNDRNMHYLGREYFFAGLWDKCIATLTRHLEMPQAEWADERCASMRYIGRAYAEKGDFLQAELWTMRAVCEAPYLREPYIDAARVMYAQKNWDGVVFFITEALKINYRPDTYLYDPVSWGSLPYDLLSVAYYYTGRYYEALEASDKAVGLNKDDPRLVENNRLIRAKTENA